MEWFFLLVGAAIFFGPIIWALTIGRNGGAPENEDAKGATAWGSFIRRVVGGGPRR
jgi:hypothetical protein